MGGNRGGGGGGDELTNRVKKLAIDDDDTAPDTRVKSTFPQHWTTHASVNTGGKQGIVIHSTTNMNEDRIICGSTGGFIRTFDPNDLTTSSKTTVWKHEGLSCLRGSKTTPEIVYSSSLKDGQISTWDSRQDGKTPAKSFSIAPNTRIGGGSSSASSSVPKLKPLLTFDVSSNDQLLCGGTELIGGEDAYLLFWDVRSTKLLGAYWESHADDVTTVNFHPEKVHSLVSGSTDGLINVFDLKEPNEDDALLYSLNTESSVESLKWTVNSPTSSVEDGKKSLPQSSVACVTHTNDVQIWDAESGDKFAHFTRQNVADTMMRSNADAVYINGCYKSTNCPMGILTCSLKGSCTRYLSICGDALQPKGIFLDHSAIVQTAQFLSKDNKWITFDEDGMARQWSLEESNSSTETIMDLDTAIEPKASLVLKPTKEKKGRKKPYSKS